MFVFRGNDIVKIPCDCMFVFRGNEIQPAVDAPIETVHVLATCHALVQLDEELVGDPLEKATLKAVDFTLTKGIAMNDIQYVKIT